MHQVAAADGWQRTHRGRRALWFFQRRKKWFRFDEYAPGSTSFAGRTADGTAIARNKDTDALAARPRACQRLFGSKGVGTGSAIAAGNVETRGPKVAAYPANTIRAGFCRAGLRGSEHTREEDPAPDG